MNHHLLYGIRRKNIIALESNVRVSSANWNDFSTVFLEDTFFRRKLKWRGEHQNGNKLIFIREHFGEQKQKRNMKKSIISITFFFSPLIPHKFLFTFGSLRHIILLIVCIMLRFCTTNNCYCACLSGCVRIFRMYLVVSNILSVVNITKYQQNSRVFVFIFRFDVVVGK